MKSSSADLPADLADALGLARDRLGAIASRVLYYETTESTNDVAARLATSGDAEGAVVIAHQQTSGRGRRGHRWFSPPGAGVYVSVVLLPGRSTDPQRATMLLTMTAGVAIAEAIERHLDLRLDIKWPNDLLAGGRKIAGILAEGVSAARAGSGVESVVLGYGINVGPAAYPADVAVRATSLETEAGVPISRAEVVAQTLARLNDRYADLLAGRFGAILDAWTARAHRIRGAMVTWATPAGMATGVTAGIDDDGALLVATDARLERIVSGEVTWV